MQNINSVEKTKRTRGRWRQFSIRSLLIAATIVAIIVGTWMHGLRTQRAAVKQLSDLGGRIEYADGFVARMLPESIRKRFGDDTLSNVVSVDIHYRTVNRLMVTPSAEDLDKAIAAVSQLPHATRLSLHTLKLQDADLARLSPLRNQISALSINELFHHDLTGSGLKYLQGCPELRSLSFLSASTGMTDKLDLRSLATHPLLEDLTIGAGTLDERVFQELAAISSLKNLHFFSCRFEGQYLKHLQALPKLQMIMLHNSHPEVSNVYVHPLSALEPGKDIDPVFRYEQTPDWGFELPGTEFPTEKYETWLRNILPGVQVHIFFES